MLITLALPQATTEARNPPGRTPLPGSAIKVSHESAMVSAIKSRSKRSGDATLASLSPKRLFESLKDCSIQPLCQYHEAATLAVERLVARYHGSSGRLRRGSFARLLEP